MTEQKSQMQHEVVVVAVDFSDTSDQAVRMGLAITAGSNRTLHVVHAVPRSSIMGGKAAQVARQEEALEPVGAQLQDYLKDIADRLGYPLDPERMKLHALVGAPDEAIIAFTATVKADILVVGTHGRTGVERLVVGSVAEQLVRRAHCPVLVARPKDYAGMEAEAVEPDPPCPDCVAVQEKTNGEQMWCDLHGREHAGRTGAGTASAPPSVHPASFNIKV